jgi:Leucine-rich repeat (LRR) protein
MTGAHLADATDPLPMLTRLDLSRNAIVHPPSLASLSRLAALTSLFLAGNPFITASRDRGTE